MTVRGRTESPDNCHDFDCFRQTYDMPVSQWIITVQAPLGTPSPTVAAVTNALKSVYGVPLILVTLAGPQSVDDEPMEPVESPTEAAQ